MDPTTQLRPSEAVCDLCKTPIRARDGDIVWYATRVAPDANGSRPRVFRFHAQCYSEGQALLAADGLEDCAGAVSRSERLLAH